MHPLPPVGYHEHGVASGDDDAMVRCVRTTRYGAATQATLREGCFGALHLRSLSAVRRMGRFRRATAVVHLVRPSSSRRVLLHC